jgi:thymidylate synthase
MMEENNCIINWELWHKIKDHKTIETEYRKFDRPYYMNPLDKQYQELLFTILTHGVEKEDRTGTGTRSIFGYTIRHNMREGFPLLTTKKMYWKGIVTELLWFLQGRTDLRYLLENGCHIWTGDAYKVYDKDFDREHPPFSAPYPKRLTIEEFEKRIMEDDEFNKWYGDLGPIYGKQWRNWTGVTAPYTHDHEENVISHLTQQIDQITNLINDLKTNPDSRRLMVNAWNVGELDQMVLPPCHYGFQVYTRELSYSERTTLYFEKYGYDSVNMEGNDLTGIPTRAISLMWNQRSVDTFLGLPFNIASYGLLLEIIAKTVNMVPEHLIGNLGDVHIYRNHEDQVRKQLIRDGYELPTLKHMKTEDFYQSLSKSTSLFGHLDQKDFVIENYKSHPAIKAPLSN